MFTVLYDTCQWSSNHTIRLLQYLLQSSNEHPGLSSIRKQRKWLIEIVIHQRIGHELFLEKLLKEGDESTLKLFAGYSELTTPLSVHLTSEYELSKSLKTKQRLSLLRYQLMTDEVFNQFVSFCSQTNSKVQQRGQNYVLLLQGALSSNDQQVKRVLQYLQQRFINERLPSIQHFFCSLKEFNNRFHLEILPNNFPIVEAMVELAMKHREQLTSTQQMILEYGLLLLQRVEYHPNQAQRERIQGFACQIIKR